MSDNDNKPLTGGWPAHFNLPQANYVPMNFDNTGYEWRCENCLFEPKDCKCSMRQFVYMSPDEYAQKNYAARLNAPEVCMHEWKEYQGILNKFDYCTKCDEKRDT